MQHWSGAVIVRPVDAARMAAGPNAVCGSGPNPKHAFEDMLTQAGSPRPQSRFVPCCLAYRMTAMAPATSSQRKGRSIALLRASSRSARLISDWPFRTWPQVII